MNKLIKLAFVLILSVLIITPNTLFAEEKPVISGDYFDIEMSLGTQSPWTKAVPINIKFRSNVTAKRVEISWDVPDGLKLKKRHPQFISTKKGDTYAYKAYVTPSIDGTYNIAGNIIDWEVDTNYTSSDSITVRFDEDLVTDPQTPGYSGAVLTRGLIIALFYAGLLAGLYFALKFAYKKLLVWLTPPE